MLNNTNTGTLNISSEVLVSIVEIAINDVDGAKPYETSLTNKIKKNSAVKLTQNKDALVVDVNISVQHGEAIQPLVHKVQDSIISALQTMASLQVEAVNVMVASLHNI